MATSRHGSSFSSLVLSKNELNTFLFLLLLFVSFRCLLLLPLLGAVVGSGVGSGGDVLIAAAVVTQTLCESFTKLLQPTGNV